MLEPLMDSMDEALYCRLTGWSIRHYKDKYKNYYPNISFIALGRVLLGKSSMRTGAVKIRELELCALLVRI